MAEDEGDLYEDPENDVGSQDMDMFFLKGGGKMNFFENELRRIFNKTEGIQNLRYIGRSCYGKLSSDIRLKAEFVTNGVSEQFEVLKVTLINKADGEIDHVKLNLADVFGLKEINTSGIGKMPPYIWIYQGKAQWYPCRPNTNDYVKLAETISGYISVFSNEPAQNESFDMDM